MMTDQFTPLVTTFLFGDPDLREVAAAELAETPESDRPAQMREFAEVLNDHILDEQDMASVLLGAVFDQVDWSTVAQSVMKSKRRITCVKRR